MSRFKELLPLILKHEGGYVDNPADTGGATNKGITLNTFSGWLGRSATKTELKKITMSQVEAIYKQKYWDVVKGDSLPKGVDYVVFDGAVQHGVENAAMYLRKAVGAGDKKVVDDLTLQLLKAVPAKDIIFSVLEQRKERYVTRPNYETFKAGWKSRLNEVADISLRGYGTYWHFDTGVMSGVPTEIDNKYDDKEIQEILKNLGFYKGAIDGIFGKNSNAAAKAFLDASDVNTSNWKDERLKIGAVQQYTKAMGFDPGVIDGYEGELTRYAVSLTKAIADKDKLEKLQTWRDSIEEKSIEVIKPTGKTKWPLQTEAEMNKFFGKPGENQVKIDLPYPMYLAWDKKTYISKMTVNEKVAEAVKRIFQRTLDHYGIDKIKELRLDSFGGSLNIRPIRGGKRLSIHAWGCAIDVDPERNQLNWGRDKAELSKSDYDKFWEFVEDEGAISLGRVSNFDWMHFQFARLK